MGILYLVATPIGNLEDITLRAARVLNEVSLIAAEDTRSARKLLTHLNIHRPLTSYYEHNEIAKLDQILAALVQGDVAVVSEAGMPGLSDPGEALVHAAIAKGIRVVPIPGATSVISALVASGLPTDQFLYLGFLPRLKRARRAFLEKEVNESRTLVLFESPHRLVEALADIEMILGDRRMCCARELTKLHEEFLRGRVSTVRSHFEQTLPRGEFTLVIEGAQVDKMSSDQESWSDARVKRRVAELMRAGAPRTDAVKRVANESGRERRLVYKLALKDKGR